MAGDWPALLRRLANAAAPLLRPEPPAGPTDEMAVRILGRTFSMGVQALAWARVGNPLEDLLHGRGARERGEFLRRAAVPSPLVRALPPELDPVVGAFATDNDEERKGRAIVALFFRHVVLVVESAEQLRSAEQLSARAAECGRAVDAALTRSNVRSYGARRGQPPDLAFVRVVAHDNGRPPGVVVGVRRRGLRYRGHVVRKAEVVLSIGQGPDSTPA